MVVDAPIVDRIAEGNEAIHNRDKGDKGGAEECRQVGPPVRR